MSNRNLSDIVPIVYNSDKYLCGYEDDYLEDLGLLKMDFLGNSNLSIIDNILKLIKKYQNIDIKFNEIPLNA